MTLFIRRKIKKRLAKLNADIDALTRKMEAAHLQAKFQFLTEKHKLIQIRMALEDLL